MILDLLPFKRNKSGRKPRKGEYLRHVNFALLKVEGAVEKCAGCGACDKMCPMDILVSQYTQSHQRVLSTECILCNECVDVCVQDALKISFGFDFGNRELLNRSV